VLVIDSGNGQSQKDGGGPDDAHHSPCDRYPTHPSLHFLFLMIAVALLFD